MVIKQNNKRQEQSVVMLTTEERQLAEELAVKLKGNISQVFRLGLSKLNEEMKRSENATARNN